MDLQKPDKSRPDTRKNQDDSTKYTSSSSGPSMNEYGRLQNPTPSAESDDVDPRQNVQERATSDLANVGSKPEYLGMKLAGQHPASPEHVTAMRIPLGICLEFLQIRQLRRAPLIPPVTKASLSELDLERIMRNIHLRSDASFEPNLHFRPDLESEQGKRKKKMSDLYWGAVRAEILIYIYIIASGGRSDDVQTVQVPDSDTLPDGFFRPRLPAMFETLLEVLKTLIPDRDHPVVAARLDVPLLMQQVQHGVLDLVSLAAWLASLLKLHCAPMRDQVVDEMVTHITEGSASQDMGRVVDGLRILFEVLEMMKLDVANYQIREFRAILIRDTVPFLQDYFRNNLASKKFKGDDAKTWFEQERLRVCDIPMVNLKPSFRPVAVLLRGLCELLIQADDDVRFPQAFQFDKQRLLQLRADIQKVINIQVCWLLFGSLVTDRETCRRQHPNFIMRVSALLNNSDTKSPGDPGLGTVLHNDASIAIELTRLVCEATGQGDDVPDSVLTHVEAAMQRYFGYNSPVMGHVRNRMRHILIPSTWEVGQRYIDMTPVGICESQRTRGGEPKGYNVSNLRNIPTRLAHVGVLHWQVWAPLVYFPETS